jgi:hypothetical protein
VALAEVVAELDIDALMVTDAVVLPLAGLDAVMLQLGVAAAVLLPAGSMHASASTMTRMLQRTGCGARPLLAVASS